MHQMCIVYANKLYQQLAKQVKIKHMKRTLYS